MIDLERGVLVFDGKDFPIQKWEVWYMTPYGLLVNLKEALELVKDSRLVIPVPVAVTNTIYEVAIRA